MQSLQDQTLPFELIWRDDGSSDTTARLVRGCGWYNLTETPHSAEGRNLGACASFARLMEAGLKSNAELFFLADQDDVWAPDKLEQMTLAHQRASTDQPQLFHHDLKVVDEEGEQIAPSLWRYMRLDPHQSELTQFLTRNSVTGCAAAFNRELLELAAPVPSQALMHDWWLGLVASVFGQVHAVDGRLVAYRQHAGNALGAKGFFHGLNPFTNWVAGWRRGNEEYRALFPQAAALLSLVETHSNTQLTAGPKLREFLAMPKYAFLERYAAAERLKLRDRGGILWVATILRILFTRVST